MRMQTHEGREGLFAVMLIALLCVFCSHARAQATTTLPPDASDLATRVAQTLCRLDDSTKVLYARRFYGDIALVPDDSCGATTREALRVLIPQLNTIMRGGATLRMQAHAVPSASSITVYVGAQGAQRAHAAGWDFATSGNTGYYTQLHMPDGRIERAAIWLANDVVLYDTTRATPESASYSTLLQELSQALGPGYDAPTPWHSEIPAWCDGSRATTLSLSETFTLALLYRELRGGETETEVRAAVLRVLSIVALRP